MFSVETPLETQVKLPPSARIRENTYFRPGDSLLSYVNLVKTPIFDDSTIP